MRWDVYFGRAESHSLTLLGPSKSVGREAKMGPGPPAPADPKRAPSLNGGEAIGRVQGLTLLRVHAMVGGCLPGLIYQAYQGDFQNFR